jgi:hypothetical protein
MTTTIVLNLIVSIVAIAGVTALMRVAHGAADERLADSVSVAEYEPAEELERAA